MARKGIESTFFGRPVPDGAQIWLSDGRSIMLNGFLADAHGIRTETEHGLSFRPWASIAMMLLRGKPKDEATVSRAAIRVISDGD